MNKNKIFLSQIILPQSNNFNFIQLLLSYLVVWNHSFSLSPIVDNTKLISSWEGVFEKPLLTGVSVPCFAFITAILYSKSLDKNSSLLRGLIRPFFRLYLNFSVAILFSALVIAPFLFNGKIEDYYFTNFNAISEYISGNLVLNLKFHINNVLVNARNNHGINGSIWMVPLFLGFYLWSAAMYGLNFSTQYKKYLAILSIFAFVIFHFSPLKNEFIPTFSRPDYAFTTTLAFLLGCIFYLFRDSLEINVRTIVSLLFIFIIFHKTQFHDLAKIAFVLYCVLFFCIFTKITTFRNQENYYKI